MAQNKEIDLTVSSILFEVVACATFSRIKKIRSVCSLCSVSLKFLLQMFAFGLNSLFELLDVNEDCYGVGYLSKVIATELANLPAARMRRKVQFVFVRFS